MKILVINFGGIGDEIFFLPTLISLKKEFPNSKITLALEPRSKSVKDLTDVIDDLILVDIKGKNKYFELLKLVFQAWGGRFDMVISSGGNKLISILLFLMGVKKRYGYDTGKLSRILLTKAVPLNKNQYACAMYHDLISPITDIKTDLPEINVDAQEKFPNSVLIHPGVSKMSVQKGMTKTISGEVWAEVVKLLLEKGKNVILAGGPDDEEVIGEIEKDLAVESRKLKVESLSLHTPSSDGERICGRTERSESGLRKDGAYCGEATNAELLEQRANSRQGRDGVILSNDSEISQAQQTDKDLSPYHPNALSPSLAQRIFDKWQNDILEGIIGLANIFDPDCIVLSGSMAEFVNIEYLEREANKEIVTTPFKVLKASAGNYSGMIGAGLLALGKYNG